TPRDKLIGTKLVGLCASPGKIEPRRPGFDRTNAIFPIIAGEKVPAGISHDSRTQLAHEIQNIQTEAMFVGGRMDRFEDSRVDTTPQMLDERAKQAAIDFGNGKIGVKSDTSFFHDCCSGVGAECKCTR